MIAESAGRIWDYMSGGGLVMAPLAGISLIMWVLIINRIMFFRRLYRRNMNRKTAGEFVKTDRLPDPRQFTGAVALLVTDFIENRSRLPEVDSYILDETVISLTTAMDRHLSAIGVLAKTAPLLGLLGTVLGMITTFDIISFYGTGNAKAMAGGISEALITTQTGLLVAIPGLYMSNFLKRRSQALKQRVASVGIYLKRHI
ncbi:MAG: MotA/TolQ/ExbB proton channel family protein [Desulfobacterales bacterium]